MTFGYKNFQNGLTPLHLCAQEDCVDVAKILVRNGADANAVTKVSADIFYSHYLSFVHNSSLISENFFEVLLKIFPSFSKVPQTSPKFI